MSRLDTNKTRAASLLGTSITIQNFCFGAPLARMEAHIGLSKLFERLPDLQLNPAYPTKPTGHEFRAPDALYCLSG